MPESECKKVKFDDTRKSQLISFYKEKILSSNIGNKE